MKKYIKPELELLKMDAECFIATSGDPDGIYGYEDGDGLSKDRSNYKHEDLGWDF